jgi:hypothetical protein
VRATFRLDNDGRGGNTTRIIDCPEKIATLEQLRDLANLVLTYGVKFTRPQIVDKRHVMTGAAFRTLQEWMLSERLVEKAGTSRNAPYELTRDGPLWLRTLLEGKHDAPF